MPSQRRTALKKRVEGEFPEEGANITALIKTLIKSFLRTDSNYGAIADINTNADYIYKLVKNYISEEKLDIYALKLGNRILMSKTSIDFEEVYEVIRSHSHLKTKKGVIEIWDDPENQILHFLILPLRKHFPIEYSTDGEKERIINLLIKEYMEP